MSIFSPAAPRIPAGSEPDAIAERWAVLGRVDAGAELLDDRALAEAPRYARNIENFIGTLRVPLGAFGPLEVHGAAGTRSFYVPLATTEATLVASYGRGAQLISAAGGCTARTTSQSVSRAPGFEFDSLADSTQFAAWLAAQQPIFERITVGSSRYARLDSVRTVIEANHVYLLLGFQTGEAAGQNMVTIATQAIMGHIRDHSPVVPCRTYIEANLSGDKKATASSLLLGRGRSACAEAEIPARLIASKLRTTAREMEAYFRMSAIGGVLSGAIGVQGHYANGLAALFLACGQDVACVAESAVGITRLEARSDGSLYASASLPNLVVGTVGGGTALPSQRACLDLLDLQGPGSANVFAELCAAVSLAGELSIVGAIVADEFTRAHASYARPVLSSGDAR